MSTLGRNTFDTPGYANSNLNQGKFFVIPWFSTEKARLETRGEFFNVFNRANLQGVDAALTYSTFGRATSQVPPRNVQLYPGLQF
jgi:hypothetical protein